MFSMPTTRAAAPECGKMVCPCIVDPRSLDGVPYLARMVRELTPRCEQALADKRIFRVLMVGMGGGTGVAKIRDACPEAVISSVEPDARVVDAARRFFGLAGNVDVEVTGGLQAVQRRASAMAPEHLDAVLVDCFGLDERVAPECKSEEFLRGVARLTGGDGLVLQNLDLDPDAAAVADAYKRVFENADVLEVTRMGQHLISAHR